MNGNTLKPWFLLQLYDYLGGQASVGCAGKDLSLMWATGT